MTRRRWWRRTGRTATQLAAAGLTATLALTSCAPQKSSDVSDDGSSGETHDDDVTLRMVVADYGTAKPPPETSPGAKPGEHASSASPRRSGTASPSADAGDSDNSGSDNATEPITGRQATKQYWHTVIDGYQRTHPNVTIDLQVIDWRKIEHRVQVMVDNGQVPDLLQAGAYTRLATSGELYRAKDVLPDDVLDDQISSLAHAGKVNDVQYGIPFGARPHLLVYNRKLFDKADLDPPRSFADVRRAAHALRDEVSIPYGIPLASRTQGDTPAAGAPGDGTLAELAQWILGDGAQLTDSDGHVTLGAKDHAKTLHWLREHLVQPGLTEKHPETTDRTELVKKFAAGKVGMMNADPALLRQLNDRQQYGVTQAPGRDGASEKSLTTSDWMMALRRNGHEKTIRSFLSYAYAPQRQALLSRTYGLLPTTKSGRDEVTKHTTQPRPWLTALGNATAYPEGTAGWPAARDTLRAHAADALTTPDGKPRKLTRRIRTAVSEAEEEHTDQQATP